MSADFGRPQGVLASVISVVAVILAIVALVIGFSASKMKTEMGEQMAQIREQVGAVSQESQNVQTQLRQLDVQTQRALVIVGNKIQTLETKMTPPPPPVVTGGGNKTAGGTTAGGITAQAPVTAGGTYAIKAGDILEKVAKKHGTTVEALQRLNPGLDPRRLKIGTQIKVPAAAAPAAR
jgi:LysM repeat protein